VVGKLRGCRRETIRASRNHQIKGKDKINDGTKNDVRHTGRLEKGFWSKGPPVLIGPRGEREERCRYRDGGKWGGPGERHDSWGKEQRKAELGLCY